MHYSNRTLCLINIMCLLALFSFNALADEGALNRNTLFQKESKKIDYYNAKNKAINFYVYGNDYGNMSANEIESNKERLDSILDSNWVQHWVNDKQISNAEIDNIYAYLNDMLNNLATNKNNENNVIAVNPLRINSVEDKIGNNNYWFNIILIPKILFDNQKCIAPVLLFSPNSCIIIPERWSELLNQYISEEINHDLNSNFVWSFFSIHELSHSLPYQLNLKIFSDREDDFRVPVSKYKNIDSFYKEVYSDLYASISLLQNGYQKEDIKSIIYMRSVSLFIYDDIDHYTAPYLQLLLDEPSINYMNIKSLDDMNDYINNLFIKGYNMGYYPDIKLYNKEMQELKPSIRKLNSFLLNLLSATDESSNKKLVEFVKAFNTTIYFSNARLRVRINNN